MREHHERVVQRLVKDLQNDPRFPALIIGGSVAKGWANEDSQLAFWAKYMLLFAYLIIGGTIYHVLSHSEGVAKL